MKRDMRLASVAGPFGMSAEERACLQGAISAQRALDRIAALRPGDAVKVRVIRAREGNRQEVVICRGRVIQVGRGGRWAAVRYRMGAGTFTEGFWPEEIREVKA